MVNSVEEHFSTYRLIRLLGQSDWAAVYLSEHLSLHTQVAIKVFSLPLVSEEVAGFHMYVKTLSRLKHAALLQVLASGMHGTRPFLVMDYAAGGSLRELHPRGTILPIPVMLSYLQPLVVALQFVHGQGLIHGNIKPENILLGQHGRILLSDMGLPVLKRKRHFLRHQNREGCAATYLAPEQIQGQPDPASDQYALGVVVYEWLCGDVPFNGSFEETVQQHLFASPLPLRRKVPSIPSYVEQVVHKALAKHPKARFASVQAFAEELALFQSPQARPEPAWSAPAPLEHKETQKTRKGQASRHYGELQPTSPALLPPTMKLSPPAPDSPAPGTLLGTYRGHTHRVQALAWSPDGTYVASASRDKTVQVWQAATGKLICSLQGHTEQVQAVTWSPGGRYLASAGDDGTVRIWEVPAGRGIYTYGSGAPIVHALAWSPSGKHIASDSAKLVEVWNALTGELSLTYRGHLYGVNALAWSPDGTSLASSSNDQTVQVWDAINGHTFFIYQGHADDVLTLAWSPDGKYLASGSLDRTVQVWGGVAMETVCIYHGHQVGVYTLTWSPDGRRLASAGGDGTVQVWDAATGDNIFTYRGHATGFAPRVNAVAWSPKGTLLASASDNGTVQVWQAP
jgi:serine/threonine protein kinase